MGCSTQQEVSHNAAAIDVLVGTEADADARAAAVEQLQPLTKADKARLLAAVDHRNENYDNSTGNSGYLFRALIRHADTDIVHALGQLLLETNNRYYAVALGVIGDEAAIPYLNTAIRQSSYSFVRDNCKQALRTFNVRNSLEHLPRASRHNYPIKPSLRADATTLQLGDRVTITAEFKNISEETPGVIYPPWIDPFHAVSIQGDHLERREGASYFFIIEEDSFRRLEPGESYTVTQTFELVIEPMPADKWWPAFENKTFDMLCLKRVEDGGGWVIARYVEGQPTTLQIAAVHRPIDYRQFVDEFNIQNYDYKDMITTPVVIECIPSKPTAAEGQ